MFENMLDITGMEVVLVIFQVSLGFLAGLVGLVLLLMLLAPLYIPMGMLVNKPGGNKKSGIHFFTFIEQGQFKIVVRGERVVRMIMDTPGSNFARDTSGKPRDSKHYWEINRDSDDSEHPLADIWGPIKPWAHYVLWTTGAVYTGVWPFQKVREYPLERTKLYSHEADSDVYGGEKDITKDAANIKEGGKQDNISLVVERDVSDHFRNRIFNFPIHITQAETNDKIPLDILLVAELRVLNGIDAAFGTDRWDRAAKNMVTDAVVAQVRTLDLDAVLSAKTADLAQAVAEAAINNTKGDLKEFAGIEMKNLRTLQIDPVLPPDEEKALRAEAIAKQAAKATRLDGSARADALRSINEANQEGGEAALAAMHGENFVRGAEAAGKGGGTVIMTPPGGSNNSQSTDSTTLTAILAELQKRN